MCVFVHACACVRVYVCVDVRGCHQVRQAIEARETALLAEASAVFDALQHTLQHRVTCCETLSHMTQASVAAAQALITQSDVREAQAIAPITLVLARAELDALGASNVEVAGNVGGLRVEVDVSLNDTVRSLCSAIAQMGNVATYREEAVKQSPPPPPQQQVQQVQQVQVQVQQQVGDAITAKQAIQSVLSRVKQGA